MGKKIILMVVIILAGVLTAFFLWPEKDYKKLALGKWHESETGFYADVTPDTITMTKGRQKVVIYYELFVDRKPLEIEVWRHRDKREVYRGMVEFKNDDEVIARKIQEESDKGDYFKEMSSRFSFVWKRVKQD